MIRTKEPNQKAKVGRPTKYTTDMPNRAYGLALLGLIDERIAELLGINTETFYRWQKEKPEFSKAVKQGKEEADTHVVSAMYQSACGYEHPSEEIKVVNNEVVRVETTKKYPPNPTSAIFWLKNRHPEIWRDRVNQEITGADGGPIVIGTGYPEANKDSDTEAD